MLFRVIAALMFSAAGCAAGAAYSLKLRENCSVSRRVCDILRKTAVFIRYTGLDVYEIAGKLKAEDIRLDFIESLPDRFCAGQNFRSIWKRGVDDEKLPEEEKKILFELGHILGTSDTEGQLAAISALENRAEQLSVQREKAYCSKGRMYRSVGVLAGVMVGILVI